MTGLPASAAGGRQRLPLEAFAERPSWPTLPRAGRPKSAGRAAMRSAD